MGGDAGGAVGTARTGSGDAVRHRGRGGGGVVGMDGSCCRCCAGRCGGDGTGRIASLRSSRLSILDNTPPANGPRGCTAATWPKSEVRERVEQRCTWTGAVRANVSGGESRRAVGGDTAGSRASGMSLGIQAISPGSAHTADALAAVLRDAVPAPAGTTTSDESRGMGHTIAVASRTIPVEVSWAADEPPTPAFPGHGPPECARP